MSSMTDLRTCSRQLLGALQRLDALIDTVSAGGGAPRPWDEVAAQAQAVSAALSQAQTSLKALAGDGPTATPDLAHGRSAVAAAIAELPLEPALQVLREVAPLVEKARTQPANGAVILVPLCLAYRHCLEAMLPLAAALDPREFR